MKVLDGSAEWNVALVASSASLKNTIADLSQSIEDSEVITYNDVFYSKTPLKSITKYKKIAVLQFDGAFNYSRGWGNGMTITIPYKAKYFAAAILDPQLTSRLPVVSVVLDAGSNLLKLKVYDVVDDFEGWVRGQLIFVIAD